MILRNGIEVGPAYQLFWIAFDSANFLGESEIRDVYKDYFYVCKDNYKYLTDFVMVLNHMIWDLYKDNERLARVYDELWREADSYACENLKDNELMYFLKMTD